jgi:diguanylate cyclase (GGDEF)-like protein/PAS domain S-box-containing protein
MIEGERILVVDDIAENRDLLCRRLQRRGYRTAEAKNGEEALRLVDAEKFDLVLLDVSMPGIDGFETLRRMRRTKPASELPVIMVTARTQSDDILQALLADANDYVTKPIDFTVLFRRVEVHLARLRAEAAVRRSEERFALAVAGSNDGIWDWDIEKGEIWFSPRWKAQLGLEEDEVGVTPGEWFARVHPDDLGQLKAAIEGTIAAPELSLQIEHRLLHKDGSYRWMLARGRALDRDGKTVRLAGSLTETTDRKLADPVTGLANRVLFQERLDHAAKATRDFAVLLVNLDRFRSVNDTYGLHVGDELLASVARRIENCAGASEVIANLGADEFGVLVEASAAVRLAERIRSTLRDGYAIGTEEVYAGASVGVALRRPEHFDGESVLRDAQLALRRAKADGGGRVEMADPGEQADALRRLALERDLRRAVERNEIEPWYQPIVRLEDGVVVGFEALARWRRDGAMVSPAEFIPVAEETGLIGAVDAQILRRACADLARWPSQGLFPFVTVNLSAKQFGEPGLLDLVAGVLEETGLDPRRLKLEITEGTIMRDPVAAQSGVEALATRRVGIAIDDFGTGYSSLAYLHRFRADTLKIDRSFVSGLDRGDSGLAIVRAIIGLAHSLRMRVVAEGVETAPQRRILEELGCGFGQGYHFAKPLPRDEAADIAGKSLLPAGSAAPAGEQALPMP